MNAHFACGAVHCTESAHLLKEAANALDAKEKQIAVATRKAEIIQRGYDRLNLCSDHRDKANGTCICCQVERNVREELKAQIADLIAKNTGLRELCQQRSKESDEKLAQIAEAEDKATRAGSAGVLLAQRLAERDQQLAAFQSPALLQLLRAFEPAVSSRIPHPEEVLTQIAALRQERERLIEQLERRWKQYAKQHAEIQRLRAALEKITERDNVRNDSDEPPIPVALRRWDECIQIARTVLAASEAGQRSEPRPLSDLEIFERQEGM
jgi:DNA repair exonuclease SbcCD ATPase subunit